MSKIFIEVNTGDKTWEEVADAISFDEILNDIQGCVQEGGGNATYVSDVTGYLDESIPLPLMDDMEIVIKTGDGEKEVIDLSDVLDNLGLAYQQPTEVLTYLLKIRQGICNMAYAMEEYYERTEDSFRVWRAEQERVLNYKDDRNPLVKDGSKTTNSAIEAYTRSQPQYEKFKNTLSEVNSGKQMLWSSKRTVEEAIELVKIIAQKP